MAIMINESWYTSNKDYWETPNHLFNQLNKEFDFTLDAAASDHNAKVDKYFTETDNSLIQDWEGRVFVNPPYGRDLRHWVEKAQSESEKAYNEVVVMVIPARPDTSYWHDYIFDKAAEIRFIRGRLKFEILGAPKDPAPFPSAIVIYKKNHGGTVVKPLIQDKPKSDKE